MNEASRVVAQRTKRVTDGDLAVVNRQQQALGTLDTVWHHFARYLLFAEDAAAQQEATAFVFPSGEAARSLCQTVRGYLATAASRDEVTVAVAVLCKAMKFPGRSVIASPSGFMRAMEFYLAEAQLPAAVLYRVVSEMIAGEEWIPSTALVLDRAKAVKATALAALDLLELPAKLQWEAAYAVRMMGMSRQEVRRNLARGWGKNSGIGRPPPLPLGYEEEMERHHPSDDDDC